MKGHKSAEERLRATIEDYDNVVKQLQNDKANYKQRIEELMEENRQNIKIYENQVDSYKH